MFEQAIQLLIILFLLSMISERISDFLKHYLCGSKFFKIQDTITKHIFNPKEEEARTYRILKINVWCGIITALILKADLIIIFRNLETASKTIGWSYIEQYKVLDYFFLLPGIILTGCFLSFGSKFWHDLLDILYEIKNAKRLISLPSTYQGQTADQLKYLLSTYQQDFIQSAYLKAKSEYMLLDYVQAVSLKRYENNNEFYFEIKVSHNNHNIGPFYNYYLNDKTPQSIPIKILVLNSGDAIIAQVMDLSSHIFEANFPRKIATLGCLVKPLNASNRARYILTCCHNVVHPVTNAQYLKPGIEEIGIKKYISNPIGKVFKGIRDHDMDAALVEIDNLKVNDILNSLPLIEEPSGTRVLNEDDIGKTEVRFFGGTSQYKKGIITCINATAKIKYSTDIFQIIELITVQNNGIAISKKGDSGSVVVDEFKKVVGIIVAGDSDCTYVIPINKMLTKFNVQLI